MDFLFQPSAANTSAARLLVFINSSIKLHDCNISMAAWVSPPSSFGTLIPANEASPPNWDAMAPNIELLPVCAGETTAVA